MLQHQWSYRSYAYGKNQLRKACDHSGIPKVSWRRDSGNDETIETTSLEDPGRVSLLLRCLNTHKIWSRRVGRLVKISLGSGSSLFSFLSPGSGHGAKVTRPKVRVLKREDSRLHLGAKENCVMCVNVVLVALIVVLCCGTKKCISYLYC